MGWPRVTNNRADRVMQVDMIREDGTRPEQVFKKITFSECLAGFIKAVIYLAIAIMAGAGIIFLLELMIPGEGIFFTAG